MKRGSRIRQDVYASPFEFAPLAVQHYVAGRMLALQLQLPVAGNVLHHAVELMMKAALAQKILYDSLRYEYGHKLVPLWERFQDEYRAMPEHRTAIEDLDRFEEIRYPREAGSTTSTHCAIFRDPHGRRMGSPGAYSLILEDVDALVSSILSERRVASLFSNELNLLPPFSRQCLLESNRHPLTLEPPNISIRTPL